MSMDEITMFAGLRPDGPGDAELATAQAGARELLVTRAVREPTVRHSPGRRPAGRQSPVRRWRLGVATVGLAAAAGTAATVALSAGGAPPPVHLGSIVTAAWTVRPGADGTVIIEIRKLADPAGLQRALRAEGVRALVRGIPVTIVSSPAGLIEYEACRYENLDFEPQAVQQAVVNIDSREGRLIIHPARMPAGSTLFIRAGLGATTTSQAKQVLMFEGPMVLSNDRLPACTPFVLAPHA
jgi:hypothetical protein